MGVSPIEYRPWEGKRTEHYKRFLVISKNVFRQKLKSKWVLAILIIGIILTHVFFIIFSTIVPHEGLTAEMMVGEDPETALEGLEEGGGYFEFSGIVTLRGSLIMEGDIYGFGTLTGYGKPLSGMVPTDTGFILIAGSIQLFGELNLLGGISGIGYLENQLSSLNSFVRKHEPVLTTSPECNTASKPFIPSAMLPFAVLIFDNPHKRAFPKTLA